MAEVKIRIDKWMWAVRLFKTRTLATDYCEKGRVRINDVAVKASRSVRPGDELIIHLGPFKKHVRILALSGKRMAAAMVKDFAEDITPAEEFEKLRLHKIAMSSVNVKGKGRPTKKDRRDIDDFMDVSGEW